jgi:hypothetical protein
VMKPITQTPMRLRKSIRPLLCALSLICTTLDELGRALHSWR